MVKNEVGAQQRDHVQQQSKFRYSMVDFLLATLVVAVAFSAREQMPAMAGALNPSDPFWAGLFKNMTALTCGLSCLGLVWLTKRAMRRADFSWHPGHYFWAYLGVRFFLLSAINLTFGVTADQSSDFMNSADPEMVEQWLSQIWNWKLGLMVGTLVAMPVLAAGLIRNSWIWKLVFLSALSVAICEIVRAWLLLGAINNHTINLEEHAQRIKILNASAIWMGVVTASLILTAMVFDWHRKVRRDWMHWGGFLVLTVFVFLPWVISFLAFRYLHVEELTGG